MNILTPCQRAAQLIPLALTDAPELFALTYGSRAHLRTWLPWVDHVLQPEDTERFVALSMSEVEQGKALHYAIRVNGALAGIISVIDIEQNTGTVGYWIGQDFQGHGYMTAALEQLKHLCFDERNFRHLNLEYLEGNARSAQVAIRCDFFPVATIPQGAFLYGRALDRIISRCWPPAVRQTPVL